MKKLLGIMLAFAVALSMMPAPLLASADDGAIDVEYYNNWEVLPTVATPATPEQLTDQTEVENPILLLQAKTVGKHNVKLTWNTVSGATKYVVYGAKCGKLIKKIATVKGNKYTVKKISKKALLAHKAYKFYVRAYDGNTKIVQSKTVHFIVAATMSKYANVTKVTAAESLSLKVGENANVNAKYSVYKNKKHLSRVHGKAIKYMSSNTNVASVDANGEVTANAEGTAVIYAQDLSGKYAKTEVTVEAVEEPEPVDPTPIPTPTTKTPKKGDLITLDGQSDIYRVIKVNGTKVEVVAMSGEKKPVYTIPQWDENPSLCMTTFSDGKDYVKYEGSVLDNYLNGNNDGDYYHGLTTNIKNAIVPQTIKQYAYEHLDNDDGEPAQYDYKYEYDWSAEDEPPYFDYAKKLGEVNVTGTRNVYALDLKDIYDYYGKTYLTSDELNQFLYNEGKNEEGTLDATYCWFRSGAKVSDDTNVFWYQYGGCGAMLTQFCYYSENGGAEARAAFTIDLSKCSWAKALSVTELLGKAKTDFTVLPLIGSKGQIMAIWPFAEDYLYALYEDATSTTYGDAVLLNAMAWEVSAGKYSCATLNGATMTFTLENDVLKSIVISGEPEDNEAINDTYLAPKPLEEVLPDDFPTSYDSGWGKSGDNDIRCWVSGENVIFSNNDDLSYSISLNEYVDGLGNTAPIEEATIMATFNTDGSGVIFVAVPASPYAELAGTYTMRAVR